MGPGDERSTNSPATGAPAISGTPRVGETLTASTSGISDADGLKNARFAYQWIRANSDIRGATAACLLPLLLRGHQLSERDDGGDDAASDRRLGRDLEEWRMV